MESVTLWDLEPLDGSYPPEHEIKWLDLRAGDVYVSTALGKHPGQSVVVVEPYRMGGDDGPYRWKIVVRLVDKHGKVNTGNVPRYLGSAHVDYEVRLVGRAW